MNLPHELYLAAQRDERERWIAQHLKVNESRSRERGHGFLPARHTPDSASHRLLRVLSDLYGHGQCPDQDPALIDRLAWNGADGE